MQMTGAQILVECLLEQGVDTIFGFPGGAVLHIYDELYRQHDRIRHILTSHEQGASHMADGYARATGKVGVCLATSGPGATNLVTGIATAYMDSIPMVAITGNVPLSLLGKDSFQEVDIAGITMPVTKHNYIVKDVKDLARILREAFYVAQEGRPGPVLVDIPKDVTAHKAEYVREEPRKVERRCKGITDESIREALEVIGRSRKPYILVGGGVVLSDAKDQIVELADKLDAPVTCSLMGMGGFPTNHPRYTGMLGMHGTKASNIGVTHCDLLVVVGARFSDRVTGDTAKFARGAQVLHIDIDPAEINKNVAAYHHIIGDVKMVLEALNSRLEQQQHAAWMEEVAKIQKDNPLRYKPGLTGQYVIERLYAYTKGNAIIATEVGQHQMWAAQFYKFHEPRLFLTSGGLGTMGYGMGAAIGAKVARPDMRVVNIAGDGSFRMNMNEIMTAVRYKIPIVVLVINNSVLGMVRQWQTIFYDERYSFTHLNPDLDYVKLCEAFGAQGYNLDKVEDIDAVFDKAFASDVPVVINCIVDKDDMVYPMVAPGKPIDELVEEKY
ncbi:biosynthetic-type acetolactate synthase large subunit [Anaerotalea alkaliphila]|uniref:Acetolactate synthase n=1 Tax=Anaerotalea alkaliphila TaxID=2662126 RepID=A0A7X5KM64_9FIRM|nr:biosynthetic-type acetolactate synthase large subunit [Anaerotalea alkaliphila]NDL67621.1 biosynthetic-type acetolactate synthase large subunit [Anaerotalea alkaliphila]